MKNKRVFLIHGHDIPILEELKSYLIERGIEPIILKDMPDNGFTLIEKFELYANKVVFAIALLTPDDKQVNETDDIFRARQNVIYEMGWFTGKLKRRKVMLLHKGKVELPSDITGVMYIEFNSSILDISSELDKELISQGLLSKY